jgi:hypothetical protein
MIKHFNLLPLRPQPPRALWAAAAAAWAVMILLSAALALSARAEEDRLRSDLHALRAEMAGLQREAEGARSVLALWRALQGVQHEMGAAQADFDLLGTIEDVAPEALWLTSVDLTGRHAIISGGAAQWHVIMRTARALDRAGVVTRVQTVHAREGRHGFTVQAFRRGPR